MKDTWIAFYFDNHYSLCGHFVVAVQIRQSLETQKLMQTNYNFTLTHANYGNNYRQKMLNYNIANNYYKDTKFTLTKTSSIVTQANIKGRITVTLHAPKKTKRPFQ